MLCTRLAVVFSLAVLTSCSSPKGAPKDAAKLGAERPLPPIGKQAMNFDTPAWKEIDQLVDEQKLEEARSKLDALLESARSSKSGSDWTRALIRQVQLGNALGGVETAVRTLREAAWPDDEFSRLVLELYYAQTLLNYLDLYDYEVNQRERLDSGSSVDLKLWTREQIVAEALRSLQKVWARRSALSGHASILGPYVELNNYPAGVRDTLRDVLSYHLVELLANTSYWRSAEHNDLFRVDHAALLASDSNAAQSSALDDAALHPIVRANAVLVDLRAWHSSAGRKAAALEAELERMRRLHDAFTDEAEHKAQTSALEARLAKLQDVAWWSMGQALLARWAEAAGDNRRAREIAQAGVQKHPGSPGAIECQSLAAALEAPEFSLTGPLIDGPTRRSLAVQHKNIRELHFRAYRSDLLARVEGARDYNLLASGQELRSMLQGAPVAEWSVTLPDLGDFASHRTFVTPPLETYGYYTIFASARIDFSDRNNKVVGAPFFVSQLVSRHRVEAGAIEISMFDGDTGAAASGVEVLTYQYDWHSGHKRIASAKTDAAGRARVKQGSNGRVFAIARRGDDVTLALGNVWLGRDRTPRQQTSAFVFTDRSVYRPNQTLHWKVLAYRGREASWKNLTSRKLTVTLHDANGEEVQKISAKTNAYGTAFGSFSIPSGRLLGGWTVRTNLGGYAQVRVEEYKRPTFEVSLLPSREPARLNHPVSLRGEAKYYFGLPVQTGRLAWKVERQERYPWWWCWWRPAQRAPQVIAAGTASLDAKGQFAVEFTPEAAQRAAAGTGGAPSPQKAVQYDYKVSVDLTDEGGETRSAARSFAVGHVSIDARLEPPGGFLRAGSATAIALHRTNLDGDPRPGRGRYRVLALQQPARAVLPADLPVQRDPADTKPRTPGDDRQLRHEPDYDPASVIASWTDGKEVAGGEIETDAEGKAQLKLPRLEGGAYRIRYDSADEFGEKLEVFRDMLVADAGTKLALPSVLRVEQASVESGGVARVLAASGLDQQPMSLEVHSGGRLLQRIDLPPGAPVVHELPITDQLRGGLSLKLVGVRDYQALEQSTSIFVPWSDRALTLDFSTFRDTLRPGSHETFRVTVRGGNDEAPIAAAELLGYMYDRSLDVFAPHSPPSPLDLYPRLDHAAEAGWSLAATGGVNIFMQDWYTRPESIGLHGDQLVFLDDGPYGGLGLRRYGYGGRVMAPQSMGVGTARRSRAVSAGAPPPASAPAVAEESAAEAYFDESTSQSAKQAEQPPAAEVRQNFAETAFFAPQLLTGPDGSAALEFDVPDSVTAWNVWVHAITRDFRSGSAQKQTRSVKDLIVRPYLPRFLREADAAQLKVVVQNASEQPLTGELTFEIFDPATQASLAKEFGVERATQAFSVPAAGSTNLNVPLAAPRRVGEVAVRVIGRAGDLSDGEQRPLPLLPSRLHLVQSKFATLRGDGAARSLQLPDLTSNADPTAQSEQLVVTVEAQLFMTVLKALPFLIDYPYECSEQTLNRFLSAGIVASVFGKYPAVKAMAADLVKRRTTILQGFEAPDPNRSTLLEESPWLQESRGLPEIDERLIKVLDPQVAVRERDRSLARLQKMQTASGGFPWFPGGPPSPYMTLYLMVGFARATEFDVALPRELVQRAWSYLGRHYREEIIEHLKKGEASPEFITLLHFATASFPDQDWLGGAFSDTERRQMLDYAFARWKKLPPLLKAILTTSLVREGRRPDAALVFASVMDSAKTTEDEGTFWTPEDRSWLWYNDRIETHAFALRTLLELNPSDPKLEGLVVWLLLNKKLNQWKSTRATAEVIYSLVKYLDRTSSISNREVIDVTFGAQPPQSLVFEPSRYQGKSQIRVDGPEVRPELGNVAVKKSGNGVAFASLTWHYATDRLPTEGRGDLFTVKRTYYRRDGMGTEAKLVPLAEGAKLQPGDEIEVQLDISSRAQAEYIHLRDPRPAGLEPPIAVSRYHFDLGLVYYEEIRDSATNFFIERLPAGQYTLKYRLRANLAGQYRVGPATLQSMYAPEFAAFSAGHQLAID